MSPPKMSHRASSAWTSTASPPTVVFAAAAASSPSYMKRTGRTCTARRGSVTQTFNNSVATSCYTGLAPPNNTAPTTAPTADYALAPPTHRELSQQRVQRYLPAGYDYVRPRPLSSPLQRFFIPLRRPLLVQVPRWTLVARQIAKLLSLGDRHIVSFLDDPGPVHLTLSPSQYSTALDGVRSSFVVLTTSYRKRHWPRSSSTRWGRLCSRDGCRHLVTGPLAGVILSFGLGWGYVCVLCNF